MFIGDLARSGRSCQQARGGFLRGKKWAVPWVAMCERRGFSPHSQALGNHAVPGEKELVYRGEVKKGSRDCSREELDGNSLEGREQLSLAWPILRGCSTGTGPAKGTWKSSSSPPLQEFSVVYVCVPKQFWS